MSLFFRLCFNKAIQNNFKYKDVLRTIHMSRVTLLYSPTSMGVDAYLRTRKWHKEQFVNHVDKFRTKMSEFVQDSKNMIFTEDLKNMVHIAEPSDLELVKKMIKKFNTQSVEYRFGSFVFGPVVMRMFHFLDAPNDALECFEDPDNKGFFDQHVSYQILLNLLYNHEMFDEMYRVFDVVKERQLNMTKFPKYSVVLIFGACYKQNTEKSYDYARKLWAEIQEAGTMPLRRAYTFFAALALKQGDPHVAVEVLSSLRPHYVTIRNIKAVALAEMGRVDDVLPILRGVLDIDTPDTQNKHTFFEDTVAQIRLAVEKSTSEDIQKEFNNIEKALRERQLIDKQTLDQLLNSEITTKKILPDVRSIQPIRRQFRQRDERYMS